MKLALAQLYVEPGEVDRNMARAAAMVHHAAHEGAEIVLLPEALPFGWMDPSAREAAQEIPGGNHFQAFRDLAVQHRVYLCTGLVERSEEKIFNAAVLFSPSGQLLLHHRKIHELAIAHDCYALGDRLGVVDTELARIGLMICADGFAPGQAIGRALALMGAQLILSPCAWAVAPEHDNQKDPYGKLWLDNFGAVTREFACSIAGCSNVGPVKSGAWAGHKCIGSSLVVGPSGEAVARGSYGEKAEEIIWADVRLNPVPRSCAY